MVQVLLRLTEEKLENEQDEDENEEQKGEEIIDDKETFISTPDIKTARDGLAYRINILSNRLNKYDMFIYCSHLHWQTNSSLWLLL